MRTPALLCTLLLLTPVRLLAGAEPPPSIRILDTGSGVGATLFFDLNDDGSIDPSAGERVDLFPTGPVVSAELGNTQVDAEDAPVITLSDDGKRLTIEGHGSCRAEVGAGTGQGQTNAVHRTNFLLESAATFAFQGSLSAGPPRADRITRQTLAEMVFQRNSSPGAGNIVSAGTDAGGTGSASVDEAGDLEAGAYLVLGQCVSEASRSPEGGEPLAEATWDFTLTVTVGDECTDRPIAWVGGRAGAFEVAANWDPPEVPLFEEDGRCDTALFEGGRDVVIDLGAPAPALAAAATPVPIHRVNHLVIKSTQGLHPKDGTIEATSLSPVAGERSLEVRNGATLVLNNGGVLARHAALGSLGEGAIEVVGLGGLLATTGRLGLGLESAGRLLVSEGATVSAAEAVLGEENAQGSVTVQGAASTLDTGSIAVGLEDDGFLVIEEGGQVTSEAGVIGFDLDGAERGRAEVLGTAPGGAPSRWALDSLDVRPNGSLSVEGGARVEIAGPLRIGGEGAEADCLQHRACVNITEGFMNAEGVAVGNGGGGRLEILPNGVLAAAGEFTIAPDEDTRAFVLIAGPSADVSVFTDLAIATGERASGGLELHNGARLDLLGRFRIGGPDDSTGVLDLIGDAAHPDDTLLTVFEGDAFDSLVGDGTTAPLDDLVASTGFLTIENARLRLSGASHSLAIQRDGRLEAHNAQIALESPAALVNRGRIVGDLIVEGDYVQEATGVLAGTMLSTPGPVLRASGLGLAAAAPPAPPFQPIVVTGNATLAGKAKLQFGNGVAPKQGDSFELLDVQGNVTGAFDEVEIAGLAPGFDFDSEIVNGALVLTSLTNAEPLPFVNLAGKPTLVESKKGAKLKLTRTGDTAAPLTVAYSVGGTATSGVDFMALPGTIEFPAGRKSLTLLVVPIADQVAETSETIEIELAPNASFAPGLASQLTIELLDGKAK